MVQPKTAVEWQSVPGSILCGSWTKDRAHYWTRDHIHSSFQLLLSPAHSGIGSTPRTVVQASSRWPGEDVTVYVWHKPAELAHSFLFCSCICFCLSSPSNCISFRKFSRQHSLFSLCSSGFISALLVLSTRYLCVKVFFSPDTTLRGWLGSKHQLTNSYGCLLYNISRQYNPRGWLVIKKSAYFLTPYKLSENVSIQEIDRTE